MPSNIPGYLTPSTSSGFPGGITLTQFIQTVIVGISGFTNTKVRPKWQVAPPKQLDIDQDWIAFAIEILTGDANAYIFPPADDGSSTLQRMEDLAVRLSFYGPNAIEQISAFRDGFQITQNLEALRLANMGFRGFSPATPSADLFNERWYNRYEVTLTLTRQVQRTYPVLSFASASGSIHTVLNGDDEYVTDWETPEAP